MDSTSEHLPGLLDDPLAQIEDLPDHAFHIAPLRNPQPPSGRTVLTLEPSARGSHDGHKEGSKLRGLKNSQAARNDTIIPDRTVKPTDINSLIDPTVLEKPSRTGLPSFVSLAAVEKKTPAVSFEEPRSKRGLASVDDILNQSSQPIHLPKPSEPPKDRSRSLFGPELSLSNLNALHQPPPNAPLLPSIRVDSQSTTLTEELDKDRTTRTKDPSEHAAELATKHTPEDEATPTGSEEPDKTPKKSRRQVHKWTSRETKDLLKGVIEHGIGKWKEILQDPKLTFDPHRTTVDLKDRFRVCCPDSYKERQVTNDVYEHLNRGASPKHEAELKGHEPMRIRLESLLLRSSDIPETTTPPTSTPSTTAHSGMRPSEDGSPEDSREHGKSAENEKQQPGRRKRRLWTQEEDEHLIQGLQKHGFLWTAMQEDPELHLQHRKATDLRDRVRNIFPESYKNAGFRPVKSRSIGSSSKAGVSDVNNTTSSASESSTPQNPSTLTSTATPIRNDAGTIDTAIPRRSTTRSPIKKSKQSSSNRPSPRPQPKPKPKPRTHPPPHTEPSFSTFAPSIPLNQLLISNDSPPSPSSPPSSPLLPPITSTSTTTTNPNNSSIHTSSTTTTTTTTTNQVHDLPLLPPLPLAPPHFTSLGLDLQLPPISLAHHTLPSLSLFDDGIANLNMGSTASNVGNAGAAADNINWDTELAPLLGMGMGMGMADGVGVGAEVEAEAEQDGGMEDVVWGSAAAAANATANASSAASATGGGGGRGAGSTGISSSGGAGVGMSGKGGSGSGGGSAGV